VENSRGLLRLQLEAGARQITSGRRAKPNAPSQLEKGLPPETQKRSPVTNEPMGKRWFASAQVANTIRGIARSGAVQSEISSKGEPKAHWVRPPIEEMRAFVGKLDEMEGWVSTAAARANAATPLVANSWSSGGDGPEHHHPPMGRAGGDGPAPQHLRASETLAASLPGGGGEEAKSQKISSLTQLNAQGASCWIREQRFAASSAGSVSPRSIAAIVS
jgi:hypothetical protein